MYAWIMSIPDLIPNKTKMVSHFEIPLNTIFPYYAKTHKWFIFFVGAKLYDMHPLYYSPETISDYNFADIYNKLPNADIIEISHKPSEFIINCTVDGVTTKQCKTLMEVGGNKRILGATFGLCYTFNMIGGNTTRADLDCVKKGGEYNGLELTLDLSGTLSHALDPVHYRKTFWSIISISMFRRKFHEEFLDTVDWCLNYFA